MEEPFDLDHLSLEANRSEWHITSRGGVHRRGPNVIIDEQKRGFWFGMSIQDENVFRVVKKRTKFYWVSPVKDTERRVENFCSLIKSEHSLIVKLNNEIESEDIKRFFSKRKHFIYFVVLVGPSGFNNQLKIEQYLPWNDPSLKQPLPKDIKMPCCLHRIHLSEDTDLQITSCLLPGELEFPISLRGVAPTTKGNSEKMHG